MAETQFFFHLVRRGLSGATSTVCMLGKPPISAEDSRERVRSLGHLQQFSFGCVIQQHKTS